LTDQIDFDFEQSINLERVSSRVAAAIIAFCEANLQRAERRFHAEDLRRFVARETGIAAPASADRILRDLRQRGMIEYRVLSRHASLYEVVAVRGHGKMGMHSRVTI
jgi:hypothetical protein